jgi:ParB/RepB/Spo0J family partition protein
MTTSLIDVNKIEKNDWNPNVMADTEYQALKQDMHVHGVNGVDPILVSPKGVFQLEGEIAGEAWTQAFKVKGYVIIDGEHRWKAAKELGWKQVCCTSEGIKEEDAKALCYRRNRERGTIDPFKEALLFKTELPKLTQAKIAGKYGVDQSTVSHRLSLLKLDESILEKVGDLPRGIITPSHLEPIATLDVKDQKTAFKEAIITPMKSWDRQPSVRDIGAYVARIKEERAIEAAIAKALETAKFPKCPNCCKGAPKRIHHKGLPWVTCGNCYHDWNLETGKGLYEPIIDRQNRLDGKSEPIKPKTIRCAHTVKELHSIFVDRIKELIPKITVSQIKVHGKLEGAEFGFEITSYGQSMSISWHQGGSTWMGFRAEVHDYKSGEKSAVDAGSPGNVEDVKQLIENAFQGKLGIEQKTKRKKTPEEIIHELHSESSEHLEADKMQVTEDPKESLAAEEDVSS